MRSTTVIPIEHRTHQPNGHLESIDRLMRSNGRDPRTDPAEAVQVRRQIHRLRRR